MVTILKALLAIYVLIRKQFSIDESHFKKSRYILYIKS